MWFWEIESEKCSKWPFEKKLEADSLNLTNEFMLYLGDKSVLRSKHMLLLCFVCDLFKCHIISCLIDFFVYANGWENSHLLWFAFCKKSNISTTHWPYVFLSKWQEKGNRNPYQEYLIQCVPFSEWLEVDLSCNLFIVHDVISPINEYIDTSFVMFLKLIKN